MNFKHALTQQQERFYPLKDHPVQTALVHDDHRIKVVPAGRRSGKTERAKRYIAKRAMVESNRSFFVAGPTHQQAKKIWWQDLKIMTGPAQSRDPSESELIIYLINGTTIHVIGLDKPQRIEGQVWHGGIIDEIADIKADAWELNIKPALNTINPTEPDYRPWCWLIGVPEGYNHYYDLFAYADSGLDPDWKGYTWKSADILPPDVIDAARRTMSPREFRQEYEASFETASGRIYEDYSKDNYTTETIKEHEQLLWFHDFNYTPMSSGIAVIRKNKIYVLDEIIKTSAVTEQSALEFVERYKNHKNKHVIIYGDPAGRAGEKHGHRSDYTGMEKVLREYGWTYTRKVKHKAPAIKDRQNAVRAKILSASGEVSLFVNSEKAPYTHKGLATTALQEGSTFMEVEDKFQHITTAIGYFIEYDYPIRHEIKETNRPQQRWGHK